MTSTLRFLGRLALVPALAYAGVTALEYAGIAGAEGGPGNGCENAIEQAHACDVPPLGSDLPPLNGPAALERVGDRLPEAALAHGLSPDQFAQTVLSDQAACVDGNDDLFYVEPAASAGEVDESLTADGADFSGSLLQYASTADPFALSIRPSTPRKIFLDFDGNVTTGTSWNNSSRPSISSAAWDLDGSPTTWSTTEQQRIREIWAAVSEDFAPFDVDVTTIDPGIEGLRKTSSSDAAFGIRVVISPTNWYDTGAGGVAYVGSFSWSTDTPAFVFSGQLGSSSFKSITEAASHETGHTLSLRHDGYNSDAYYMGQGTWAPIMGVGYYRATTQWSKGEYPGATNTEDDLAVIQNHVVLRGDDHSNGAGGAAPLATGATTVGTIETRGDQDFFRVDAGAGTVAVTLSPAAPSSDLDAEVALLDGNGVPLVVANPAGTGAVSLSASVPAGSYSVRVDGVGSGDLATGYSDYASLGRYTVTATYSGTGSTTTTTAPTTTAAPTSTAAPTTTTAPTTTAAPTTTSTTTTTPAPTTTSTTTTTTTVPARVARVSSVTVRRGSTALSAVAEVTLIDAAGQPIASAVVTGTWTGQAKGTSSATTGSTGTGTTPDVSVRRSGKVAFGVTSVRLPAGYVWDGVIKSGSAKV